MWALAHTHEHRRPHIHYSSRTPSSVEYTQHIGRAHVSRSHLLDIRQSPSSSAESPKSVARTLCAVQASVRPDTQGRQTACLAAPSLLETLADCGRPRAQPHRRFSTVENRSRRPLKKYIYSLDSLRSDRLAAATFARDTSFGTRSPSALRRGSSAGAATLASTFFTTSKARLRRRAASLQATEPACGPTLGPDRPKATRVPAWRS